jgi:alpha-N-acetylglucosaminidase
MFLAAMGRAIYTAMQGADADATWVLQGWFLYYQAKFGQAPQARALAGTQRRLYEWNARDIITLWGTKCTEGQNDDLNLYAYKEWEGMFTSCFLPRWQAFFDQLNQSLTTGVPFDRAPFAAAMCAWEQEWSRETGPFPTAPRGNAVSTARRLASKYSGLLQ